MPVKSKKEEVAQFGINSLKTIDPDLDSFIGHPYFKERAEAMKKLLQKVGLPQFLIDKGYSVDKPQC